MIERASRIDMALTGDNIFDVVKSSSDASPIALPAKLRRYRTLVGEQLGRLNIRTEKVEWQCGVRINQANVPVTAFHHPSALRRIPVLIFQERLNTAINEK